MPIHQPGRVLLKHVPLDFVAKKVGGHGAKAVDVSIPLVPFIDFLIVLVVFHARALGTPRTTEEATEVQAFAPDAIPWPELAFWSTERALREALASGG